MTTVKVTMTAEQAALAVAVVSLEATKIYRELITGRADVIGRSAAQSAYLDLCAVWDAFGKAEKVTQ